MLTIVLLMHRKAIAHGLMEKIRENSDISMIHESDYDKGQDLVSINNANIALIEVTESGPFDMSYCLKLCSDLRKDKPECKLLLMCSEQNENTVKLVIAAKGEKKIDDFVFYDVTIDYLISKLISMS